MKHVKAIAGTATAVCAAALALAFAAGSAAVPDWAHASCVPVTVAGQLARADVAFVGRLVERHPDRLVLSVDEPLKGSPGAMAVIPQPGVTSVSLNPRPGEPIGLTARRAPDGSLAASECDRSAPENLRAAAAAPDTDCSAPRVRALRALKAGRGRRILRLHVSTAGAQGRTDRLDVDWGDGSGRTYRFDTTVTQGANLGATLSHRFRRTGRRRITVTASAKPALACAAFGMPPREVSAERTLTVRVGRGH